MQNINNLKPIREDKRQKLINVILSYADSSHCVDLARLRKERKNDYVLISHYFKSIPNALKTLGLYKAQRTIKTQQGKSKQLTLENKLAIRMIEHYLINERMSYNDIANKFGVSRACVRQLYIALQSKIEEKPKHEITDNVNNLITKIIKQYLSEEKDYKQLSIKHCVSEQELKEIYHYLTKGE